MCERTPASAEDILASRVRLHLPFRSRSCSQDIASGSLVYRLSSSDRSLSSSLSSRIVCHTSRGSRSPSCTSFRGRSPFPGLSLPQPRSPSSCIDPPEDCQEEHASIDIINPFAP